MCLHLLQTVNESLCDRTDPHRSLLHQFLKIVESVARVRHVLEKKETVEALRNTRASVVVAAC